MTQKRPSFKVKINGTDYNLKYTIRALFMFEQITGKPFEIKTLLDNYVFFYCLILANNQDNILDWNDFLEALDNDPTIFNQINAVVEDYNRQQNKFEVEGESKEGDTEKKN